MATTVTINDITGTTDYHIWVCTSTASTASCLYVTTIADSDLPYSFSLPTQFEGGGYCIKIVDSTGCEIKNSFGL